MIPLIKNFQATSIPKAFILNALSGSIIILIAMLVKQKLDNQKMHYYRKKDDVKELIKIEATKTSLFSVVVTFIVTFFASIITYSLLHLFFGYGYGMLRDTGV